MTLKELRKTNNLTQLYVAEKLQIHRTTLMRIERGQASLKAEQINILANLYKISPDFLLNVYNECRE